MSAYNYTPNGQNGQQYNQYMQQYASQGFQQLGAPQSGQYRSIQQSAEHELPYQNLTLLPTRQSDADLASAPALNPYQDYSGVYVPSHEPPFATPPQPRYPVPQLLPHGVNRPYQHVPHTSFHQSSKQQSPSSQVAPPVQIPAPRIPQKPQSAQKPATAPAAKKAKITAKRASTYKKAVSTYKKADGAENDSEDDDYSMDGMKTKSGRKVHKPSQFTPTTKTPSKKRGNSVKKIVQDSLFCKVCDRGHSPKSNLIVFCDGCNSPYHQLCHAPIIDNLLVTLPDAEWFCSVCDERRGQRKLEMGHTGSDLTENQKKTYMTSLPTSHLVQLVMYAASKHPELGLFSPNAAKQLETVHKKHAAAILEEQGKLVAPIYQAVPGDEIKRSKTIDSTLEAQIIEAVKALNRPAQNRDVMEYIESHHLVDPSTFRVRCAEQISQSIENGRLEREGALLKLGQSPGALGPTTTIKRSPIDATLQNHTEDQQYPRVPGIKLPPVSTVADGFSMQEYDSPAFKHVAHDDVLKRQHENPVSWS